MESTMKKSILSVVVVLATIFSFSMMVFAGTPTAKVTSSDKSSLLKQEGATTMAKQDTAAPPQVKKEVTTEKKEAAATKAINPKKSGKKGSKYAKHSLKSKKPM